MPNASYQQSSFLGGEISKSYSGRYDLPAYKQSLQVCLNFIPIDTGALARRGGTQFSATTRGGAPGRTIAFDVAGGNPIYLEFTDLFLRARVGPSLVTTNDNQVVAGVSSANPAVVQTAAAHGWTSANRVTFPAINMPLLQNRVFRISVVDATHLIIGDEITGTGIDGSTLGSFTSGTVARVLEISTSYGGQSWQAIRSVQAESQSVLLNGSPPQILDLTALPTAISQPTFTLAPVNFLDGPYLDPFPGSICTYSAVSGNPTLTFSFQPFNIATFYSLGDYVTLGGQGYKSLIANNGTAPPNANWKPVNGGAPVGPNGFTSGDIGRHVRLFSEPPAWVLGTSYSLGAAVKYGGSYWLYINGTPGSSATPGHDATVWSLVSGAAYAQWTWGRIVSISGSGLINPVSPIGNYAALASIFDGNLSKPAASCASESVTVGTFPAFNPASAYSPGNDVQYAGGFYGALLTIEQYVFKSYAGDNNYIYYNGRYYQIAFSNSNPYPPPPNAYWVDKGVGNPTNTAAWAFGGTAAAASIDAFAGQNFSASPKQIASVTLFPSTDAGFGSNLPASFAFNLRAKHSAPSSPFDGTVIGNTGAISNTTSPVSITSTDTITPWEYVWPEMVAVNNQPLPDNGSHLFTMTAYLAQVEFFGANIANGSVVVLQLVGPPLLYPPGTVVNTWRAGLYSNTAGWPLNGTYAQGRLWLGGAVDNRFDASVANGISGATINFAPTGPDGTVAADNAISYTLNAPDVNPILWMLPDSQGVLLGTQKREWLVTAASNAAGLGPTNIVANPSSHIGCANIEPRRTDHTIVFVQKHARKIMEAFADVFSGKFTAPNLMEKARHLTPAAIQEIAYQQELVPVIWARCGDGSWFGLTYKRDTLMTSQGPTYCAPHRHALGSGRLVESIAVGPSPDGTLDALMMVTNDPATGIRHVELMTPYFEETSALQNAWQLDDAVVPTSTSAASVTALSNPPAPTDRPYGGLVINGLWHLNGKAVQVFAAGLDCGARENGAITDFVVTNGSVTVPYGDGVSAGPGQGLFTAAFVASFTPVCPIVVGFVFNSDAQLLRPNTPQDTGARNGPGFGKKRRNHDYALQVVQAQDLQIGTDFTKLDPVAWQDDSFPAYPANQLFNGVLSGTFGINDTYSFDGQICWRAARVRPAMITAAGGFIETTDH